MIVYANINCCCAHCCMVVIWWFKKNLNWLSHLVTAVESWDYSCMDKQYFLCFRSLVLHIFCGKWKWSWRHTWKAIANIYIQLNQPYSFNTSLHYNTLCYACVCHKYKLLVLIRIAFFKRLKFKFCEKRKSYSSKPHFSVYKVELSKVFMALLCFDWTRKEATSYKDC